MTRIKQQSADSTLPHPKHGPQRTCIGCRTPQHAKRLLRLVCTAEGQVRMDFTGRLPGRGAYVCYQTSCLRRALQPARLSLVLKQSVLPVDWHEAHAAIVQAVHTRLCTCLGMAQKAGAIVSGSDALHKALTHAGVQGLILAEDAVASRVAEYEALCAKLDISCARVFSKDELGRCIGKSPRTAIGLCSKHFSNSFFDILQILQQLQTL